MDLLIGNSGFTHISSYIFECLDNKSLCQSRLVNKKWRWFIDQRKFKWIRILQIRIEKIKTWLESNKDWADVIETISDKGKVEDVINLTLIFNGIKSSSLHFGITPLHQAVYSGDLKTVSFLGLIFF